jgi:hypothetical protein
MAGATGLAIGMAEKQGVLDFLPEVPLVGRKGALAIGLAFLMPRNPYAVTASRGLAFLSGYEYGKEGSISGQSY